MALKEYKQKRSFTKTPEPKGGKPDGKSLLFVVQKHAASHLHYDFRLEMEGVLKSWAIPKGPSLNPADKRLAMQVEDHPFDYKDFEGIIPDGNYGAGTVMVWDTGTYEPMEEIKGPKGKELKTVTGTKATQNKVLLKELHSGSLKFRLNGKKLKGEFALVQTKGRGDNSWLLIKHRDKYATDAPVIDKDKSVVSKKTLEQIAKNPNSAHWESNKKTSGARAAATAKAAPAEASEHRETSKQRESRQDKDPSHHEVQAARSPQPRSPETPPPRPSPKKNAKNSCPPPKKPKRSK